MKDKKMAKVRTIIYGGSFDPLHAGHIEIALTAFNACNADKVVFMPAKNPPWKQVIAPPFDRLNMLKFGLSAYLEFEISELELFSDDEINYTYLTLEKYQNLHKDEEVALLIGSDQANKFSEWYKAEQLAKNWQIIVYERPDYKINDQIASKYNMEVVEGSKIDASSTKIRQLHDAKTPLSVLHYIARQNLYYMPKLHEYLSPQRLAHSLRVARLAYEIAAANKQDYGRAYVAALLHDIGKEIPEKEVLQLIKKHFDDEELINSCKGNEYMIHQLLGAVIAKEDFGIEDEEVIDAIAFHSSGKAKMTTIGKIVYSADKIEPGRKFDSRDLIAACLEDHEQGFLAVLEANVEFLANKGAKTDNRYYEECAEYYLGKGAL